jgi:hypothetical protein
MINPIVEFEEHFQIAKGSRSTENRPILGHFVPETPMDELVGNLRLEFHREHEREVLQIKAARRRHIIKLIVSLLVLGGFVVAAAAVRMVGGLHH